MQLCAVTWRDRPSGYEQEEFGVRLVLIFLDPANESRPHLHVEPADDVVDDCRGEFDGLLPYFFPYDLEQFAQLRRIGFDDLDNALFRALESGLFLPLYLRKGLVCPRGANAAG